MGGKRKEAHLIRWKALPVVAVAIVIFAQACVAETYEFKGPLKRKLQVVREYEIPVARGKPTIVVVPALMSFWGVTNQQVIRSSEFTYSIKPDSIEVTTDNLGTLRRNYEMRWYAPDADKIHVKQVLVIDLACGPKLYTAARLPYSDEVLEQYETSLGPDEEGKINPDNPELEKICSYIRSKGRYAENVVEDVCDWINENIKFKIVKKPTSDSVLARKQGQCSGMAMLACSILRRMGIPAELTGGKFIGGTTGHGYMEVYYPDAGWVFYDLSNHERGFKSLDCLMTVGWSFRVCTAGRPRWISGLFCEMKDMVPYPDKPNVLKKAFRKGPKGMPVVGMKVVRRKPPPSVKVRHMPINRLLTELAIPPGKREYVPPKGLTAEKAPAEDVEEPPKPVVEKKEVSEVSKKKAEPESPEKKIERECIRNFDMARSYSANKMPDKARKYLQRIIDQYPNTAHAEKAKKELEKIK